MWIFAVTSTFTSPNKICCVFSRLLTSVLDTGGRRRKRRRRSCGKASHFVVPSVRDRLWRARDVSDTSGCTMASTSTHARTVGRVAPAWRSCGATSRCTRLSKNSVARSVVRSMDTSARSLSINSGTIHNDYHEDRNSSVHKESSGHSKIVLSAGVLFNEGCAFRG